MYIQYNTDYIYNYESINRCFGNRQSLRARQRERLAMAFEKTPNKTSNVPNSKVKSPVGNFENIIWDKQQMKEVMSYGVGTLINWSDLARRYNIKTQVELKNGWNQLVLILANLKENLTLTCLELNGRNWKGLEEKLVYPLQVQMKI